MLQIELQMGNSEQGAQTLQRQRKQMAKIRQIVNEEIEERGKKTAKRAKLMLKFEANVWV